MSDSGPVTLVFEQLRYLGFDDELIFSIVFSRITREARRVYGLEGAQNLLKPYVKPASVIDAEVEVKVPDGHFRMDAEQTSASDHVQEVIDHVRRKFGNEAAFKIVLTRSLREAERIYGDAATQQLLRGLIDTMPEAAQYDRS